MSKFVKLPKAAVFGAANGVMFMTFFGALWASIGIIGSRGLGDPWSLVLSSIVTLILLSGAISLFGKARNMNHASTPEEREHWRKINRKFGLIFGLEGLAIFIASMICNIINNFEVFFPIMAIIVGIHFFPLARLFRENFYYGTGVMLCILGVITFFLPMNATVNNVTLIATSTFIGFGSALTLWVTGLRIWTAMLKQLKQI
ncbi:hypothetical protein ACFQI7_37715 [Paenibacillus allorhizosphaerae]|uniref:Uncharacterized protein n=1 Tax=Paenibacillus allorhizosphaerae TaxID=2849866 RepID=A0ABM8VV75_9BACL|nr:hypothetical protein [Paenibacillus allorhizosphaerae]CAG7659213.1 hypothetical protein PAECIP111802_07480 [Paenibacillus allorhizosphaerae]